MENLKTSLRIPGYIGKIILKWVLEDNWLMKVSYGRLLWIWQHTDMFHNSKFLDQLQTVQERPNNTLVILAVNPWG